MKIKSFKSNETKKDSEIQKWSKSQNINETEDTTFYEKIFNCTNSDKNTRNQL